jgi:hypothetical protein
MCGFDLLEVAGIYLLDNVQERTHLSHAISCRSVFRTDKRQFMYSYTGREYLNFRERTYNGQSRRLGNEIKVVEMDKNEVKII